MSHWNHRVMRRVFPPDGEEYFSIHEVYYDENRKADGWTENAASVQGESIEALRWKLQKMLECLDNPVLNHENGETV